jgi:hypothetical protein
MMSKHELTSLCIARYLAIKIFLFGAECLSGRLTNNEKYIMPKKYPTLFSNRKERIRSVKRFNIRTLKTLNYYGGYSTTNTLSIIHDYTKAGVRKRMNAMVRCGWVEKIEVDEGLGRSEQLWCISRAGRLAAFTDIDEPLDAQNVRGFSISEYSPSQANHTRMLQIIACTLADRVDAKEISPFKISVRNNKKDRYVFPDIVFYAKDEYLEEKRVSVYDLYEVELTVKTFKRYQDIFMRLSIHNEGAKYFDHGFVISYVIFITTPQLQGRLENVLNGISSNIEIYVINYEQLLSTEDIDFQQSEIETSEIDSYDLQQRMKP